MKWLHLVRNGQDDWVAELVRYQAARDSECPAVVLLHEALRAPLPVPEGVPVHRGLDDDGIVGLIEEYDRVVVW